MTDAPNQALEKSENRQLWLNRAALGLALGVLVGIMACIAVFVISDQGLFFGMLLAGFFPYVVALGMLGLIGYVALFFSNLRAQKTSLRTSRGRTRTWSVFLGLTACAVVIFAAGVIISLPVIGASVQSFKRRNPVVTAPVNVVPTYPSGVYDLQSQAGTTRLFKSYNVRGHHPDEIADWYQEALSNGTWSVLQTDRFTERRTDDGSIRVLYCIQARRTKRTGPTRLYFIEIFGRDGPSSSVHVNIGTPAPMTDVCRRFVEQP